MPLPVVLRDLLTLPTAAFLETAVLEYVRSACAALAGVKTRTDEHGNLLAHYQNRPRSTAPVVFTAHTDHPGFCALRMTGPRELLAAFRGWVEPEYFEGTKVRFWSAGRWVRGRVRTITKAAPIYGMIGRTGRPEEVLIQLSGDVQPNSPGMWDLPDPAMRGDKVTARGCDDIAGCAAMLALLQRLAERRARANVYCLFTRAEEVGFIGAIGAARSGTIPRGLPIVAIETSKELPTARIGDGPILRVGDKTSVFTPAVTAFCDRVAKGLAERCKVASAESRRRDPAASRNRAAAGSRAGGAAFAYQRKLMDGGTCESTAYYAYGYPATGICVALGNYHNMDTRRKRIASEYISLRDWVRMVDWFEALALDEQGFRPDDGALKAGLERRFAEYAPLLGA